MTAFATTNPLHTSDLPHQKNKQIKKITRRGGECFRFGEIPGRNGTLDESASKSDVYVHKIDAAQKRTRKNPTHRENPDVAVREVRAEARMKKVFIQAAINEREQV